MRIARVGALACAIVGASFPVKASEPNYQPVFEALFSHMAVAYMCRADLGGLGHYQAARTIAVSTVTQILGRAEAIRGVDNMDRKFRNDPRADNVKAPPSWCIEQVNEGLHRIEVERVKAGLVK